MIVCFRDTSSLDEEELLFRRKSLRKAVLLLGFIKIISVICYAFLLYFVKEYNFNNDVGKILMGLVALCILPQAFLGAFLFWSALVENVRGLEISILLTLIMAAFRTVVGVVGAVYYIKHGVWAIHSILALIFGFMALSVITDFLTDVLLIYTYKKTVAETN